MTATPQPSESVPLFTGDVQNMTYNNFFSDMQRMMSTTNVKKSQFKETLLEAMKKAGMETELRNTVFHWVRSHNNAESTAVGAGGGGGTPAKEPLGYLRKAQMQWERRIQKSLNSMCNEIGVPLARYRPPADRDDILEKWNELSTYDVDLGQYRPVYAPKDFLEVLLWIRSPNYQHIDSAGVWDFTQIPLKVKTFPELRLLFADLARGQPLLGVNPHMPSAGNFPTLEAERTSLGEKVLGSEQAPVAQEFLKRGCPRCLRGRLWAQVLGCDIKPGERRLRVDAFKELKQRVLSYDLMVDKLIIKDVQLTASNDDQYFVFEDVLYQVMLCFSRDTEVLDVFRRSAANPVSAAVKGGVGGGGGGRGGAENSVAFPPSGVIPFHGFTMYASPFCYLHDDPVALYLTFRTFYMRYWFRLHEVSSHEQGILSLCLLFEKLLQRHEPQLWYHLKQIKVAPIRLVFKWLMRAFSGHLPPEQLLFLWDLILAYDSLEVLPLLAVSIISFRKDNLMQVDTLQSVEAVLADLSSIAVMPLLQITLMRE